MKRTVFKILTFYPILKKMTHYSIKGLNKKELNDLKDNVIREGYCLTENPDKDEIINAMNSMIYEEAIEVITKIYMPAITAIATVIIAIVAVLK